MEEKKEPTLAQEAGLDENWHPIDSAPINPAAAISSPNPMANFFSGPISPTLQHDKTFVDTQLGTYNIAKLPLVPLSASGQPSVGSAVQSGSSTTINNSVNAVAGGPNGAIQFNSGGALAGSSVLTFNSGSNIVTITGGVNVTGSLVLSGTVTASVFNATTGFQIAGAAGVGKYLRGNGTDFVSATLSGTDVLTGLVGVTYGGTGSNLSATGGAHEVLLQSTLGGAVTVGQLAFTDISGVLAITSGGTGTATPGLVAGNDITITGSWPDNTIAVKTQSGVTAGSYTNTNLTVDAQGIITAVANGSSGVTSLNTETGAVTIVAGSGVTVTPSGSNITIAATGGASGGLNVTSWRRKSFVSATQRGAVQDFWGDSVLQQGGSLTQIAPTATHEMAEFITPTISTTQGWNGDLNYRVGKNISFYANLYLARITNVRAWIGVTDQTQITMAASDNPAGNYAAFRFSTIAGDSTIQCITKDGTTQTIVDSLVAPVANTGLNLSTVFNDSVPNVVFYINGVVVATITSHLPTAGTNTRYVVTTFWTVNATSAGFGFGQIYLEHDSY
jgi:hypothetical protein